MRYYGKYIVAMFWMAAWSAVYGVFMWTALLLAPVEAETLWGFVAEQAFTYAFLLVIGALPLFLLLKRDRARN